MTGPSGTTRVAGVIGDPVAHSRSPAMHNAAFTALGLDWIYVAFPVPTGSAEDAVRAVEAFGLGGLSVTMPHKADAARGCDRLTDVARTLGAVNTVVPTADGLVGDSTDGEGFLRSLGDAGVDPSGAKAVVLGAGGAARAIVHALGTVGASVTVAARRADVGDIALDDVDEVVADADMIVNATPLGMHGEDPPFSTDLLVPTHIVVDIVTADTPLLAAARSVGATAVDGIGMLVHQGAIAFELWTGAPAPVDVMRSALAAPQ